MLRTEADFFCMELYFELLDRFLSLVQQLFLFGGLVLVGFDRLRATIDLGAQILGVAVQSMKLSQNGCGSRHEGLRKKAKDIRDTMLVSFDSIKKTAGPEGPAVG